MRWKSLKYMIVGTGLAAIAWTGVIGMVGYIKLIESKNKRGAIIENIATYSSTVLGYWAGHFL